ncbi:MULTISPECIES: protein DsrB [Tatumella]|uniref:Protein DsrB n=1 Tax=Tatumella terrea TaxID=419007 RepID=A0ABW1VUE9_9GAMM|nr:protein DsrB [Tatumella sp. JGM118]MBS0908523.1 protein DsrB [Tatumella sp. JGM118]
MQVDEWVSVKTAGGSPRTGKVLAVETFSEGIMYLVALEDYPRGIWFFNENTSAEGIFVQPAQAPAGG